MDCLKAQRLWDDSAAGRLTEPVAAELQRHLADCSDCRVARHRADRLQQLLALKRYETPASTYFEGFLGQFHHRLETQEQPTRWWHKLMPPASVESPAWPYGLGAAAAASLLIAVGLYWQQGRAPAGSNTSAATTVIGSSQIMAVATPPGPALIATPAEPPRLAAGAVLTPAAPNASNSPRYVLDRITITPASYEPGSVRF